MNAPADAAIAHEIHPPAEPTTPVSPASGNIQYQPIPCGLKAPPKNLAMSPMLFAGGCLPALLMAIGCAQADTRVVAYSYQTTKEHAARVAPSGPAHLVDVPAFYLVAVDKASCEVDSVAYLAAHKGSRVACDWVQP